MKTGNDRPDLPLAVVVSAGSMGMAAARRLGQRFRLLLVDVDAALTESRAAALCDDGYDAKPIACDITDAASVGALAEAVAKQGSLRVLAHVAGLSPVCPDWQTVMRVNLVGARLVEQALLPHATRDTAAIFVASLAAHLFPPLRPEVVAVLDHPLACDFLPRLQDAVGEPMTPTLAYQLSKTALVRMCGQRAAAWGRQGARILSLSPGLIATPMGAEAYKHAPQKTALLQATPCGREGTMMEIADAFEFLASERASFISGVDILVDGGVAAAMKYRT